MKFTVKKSDILLAFQRIQNIAERKTTMPVLSNALLEAKGDNLTISATDLDVGLTSLYPADITEGGSSAILAKKAYEIIKEVPEEEIHFSLKENNWMEITCGRVLYRLASLPGEEFPSLPTFSEKKSFSVSRTILRRMIEYTIFAVSSDETRYNISGVYFEPLKKKNLRMVSTDGHRLSMVEENIEDAGLSEVIKGGVIVPKKGISELKRLLDTQEEDTADVGIQENTVFIKMGDTTLLIRLVEGEFPNYSKVIPKGNDTKVLFDRMSFLQSLRRVSILSIERTKSVIFTFSPGKVELVSNNPDLGEAREDIECDYSGEEISIGFNARYLIEGLQVIEDPSVLLELKNESSAVILRPKSVKEFLYVIMPMRF